MLVRDRDETQAQDFPIINEGCEPQHQALGTPLGITVVMNRIFKFSIFPSGFYA